MPPRKGRKANATSTATQPPTIEPQQEPGKRRPVEWGYKSRSGLVIQNLSLSVY